MAHPNILFITTDQQRCDTLGCYDNTVVQTPNIDRLAAEGVQFDRAYSECPICIPTRNTWLTGLTAAHHGATVHCSSIRPGLRTIGDVLQEHGYRTHQVGKPHFKNTLQRGNEESFADWADGKYRDWSGPYLGFQTVEFVGGLGQPWYGHYGQWLARHHPEAIAAFAPEHHEKVDFGDSGVFRHAIPEGAYTTTYIAERACEFLREAKRSGGPFFCHASFPDPHWPIAPPEPWFSMYDGAEVPAPIPYAGEAESELSPKVFRVLKSGQWPNYDGGAHYMPDVSRIDRAIRPYWGSVSMVDKYVGVLLDTLGELGLAEDTLVVFTSDHGEHLGDHGMIKKGDALWETFVRVPFIVRLPGRCQRGVRTDALCSSVDVVPTFLELLGLADGDHDLAPDGVSQAPVLTGQRDCVREAVTIHHPTTEAFRGELRMPDQYALVTDRWKLVYHAGDPNGQLYDLQDDPQELRNRYNDPACAQWCSNLKGILLDELIFQNDKVAILESDTADPSLSPKLKTERELFEMFGTSLGYEKAR